ncbi:tubby-related protein 3-like protein [Leptotrombidium deliense]|uniref:Tubby-like protein n=1 Tax=Leptotrombidium deliense TaxID=299467 RepID=A0A443STA2_9ACAR|nr:tubby-related protein 3-like protein [Leptotrombidium deliense]
MALNSEATKWSRNLRSLVFEKYSNVTIVEFVCSEETQTDSNRLRLIERQRQLLESKRQRQQQIMPTAARSELTRDILIELIVHISLVVRSAKSISSFEKYQDKLVVDESKDNLDGISNPSMSPAKDLTKDSKDLSLSSPVLSAQRKQIECSYEHDSPIKVVNNDSKQLSNVSRTPKREAVINETKSASNDRQKGEEIVQKSGDVKELNPLTTILNNNELLLFVTQPIPPSKTYQCVIIRDKRGIDRSFYPTYYMHLQGLNVLFIIVRHSLLFAAIVTNETIDENSEKILVPSSPTIKDDDARNRTRSAVGGRTGSQTSSRRQIFLLGGRRRKRSKTYLIGNDPFDITRDNCIAKLKSNVLGTQFNAIKMNTDGQRYEIVSILYETNVLGFKGPRKMTALIPKNPEVCRSSENTLFDIWKCNNKSIHQLKNKTPVWNEDTQSYVLNFHGRVTQASVKNFQLVVCGKQKEDSSTHNPTPHSNESPIPLESPTLTLPPSSPPSSFAPTIPAPSSSSGNAALDDDIALQFGRVSEKEFTCDVTWPMSLLQAFAIALSSFDSKLACE